MYVVLNFQLPVFALQNILQNIMPGAAEFQTPTHMGRTSRTPVSR